MIVRLRSLVARPVRGGTVLALLATLALAAPAARAEVQVERMYLPDASPSSFAIALPGGVNFCFDPVRGAVSYAWTGGFLDSTPTRPAAGKFIAPAKLLGPIAYKESGVSPLRRGDPKREPVVEFTGYSLRADSIEFRYTIDGTPVREEISAKSTGILVRRLHISGGTDAKWWHVVDSQPPAELRRDGAALVLELPLKSAP